MNLKEHLKKQDLVWKKLPRSWDEGAFLGNGILGNLVYFTENALYMEVCNGLVCDKRENEIGTAEYDRSRLPIGHLLVHPKGKILSCNLRLDLYNATLKGHFKTDKGKVEITSFVHTKEMVIYLKAEGKGGEDVSFEFVPANAISPRQAYGIFKKDFRELKDYVENPAPYTEKENSVTFNVQPLKAGGEVVTAYKINNNECFTTVCISHPEKTAKKEAVEILSKEFEFDAFYKVHIDWWNDFYKKSFLSLSYGKLEAFYYIQLYKIASATRENGMLVDCCGPWLGTVTPWPLTWWNLNVQLTYLPVCQANHPYLAKSLINHLDKYRDNLKNNVPEEYRKNAMVLSRVSDNELKCKIGAVPHRENGIRNETIEIGNLTWALHNCYIYYKTTLDEAALLKVIFPILKESINYFLNFLYEEDDVLHLMVTSSPEYEVSGEDCTYNLSLLKWGLKTLVEINDKFNLSDEKGEEWKKTLEKLAPLPTDENEGWLIAKDVHYDHSHRHFSHILEAYPLCGSTDKELIIKTINHWHKYKEGLQGYTFTGTALMYEQLGMGNEALESFENLFGEFLRPNTMYKENGPVIETPLSGAQVISEMLMQSHNDLIKIFPAMPDKIKNACFENLRAEGAFLVSAGYKKGRTQFVKVKSLKGGKCNLKFDLGEAFVIKTNTSKIEINENIKEISINMKEGEEVLFIRKGAKYKITPVKSNTKNYFGLN